MIKRDAQTTLKDLAKGFPITVITGPRQSGKSVLSRHAFPDKTYVTFDEIDILETARADPRGFLSRFPKGAVIDEAQKMPELFPYLKARVDRDNMMGEFVLTGSQQFSLMSRITESLSGRAGFIQLLPFSIIELHAAKKLPVLDDLIFRGSYPPIYDRKISPQHWFVGYVTTYIERDIRNILNVRELGTFQRFLRLCAARVGQLLNISSLANDCGISTQTAKSWISVLESSYIIFLLQPHFANFGKRLIKSPKIYFYDTGLASWLLNIQDPEHLGIHPSRGPLFENLIICEMLKQRYNHGLSSNLYFWRDNLGDEIDVLVDGGKDQVPIEIKSGKTITDESFKTLSKWKKITGKEAASYLIYSGNEEYKRKTITIFPWQKISQMEIGKR